MNCEFCFCKKGACVCRKGMWDDVYPNVTWPPDSCLTDECGCANDCECPPDLPCTCTFRQTYTHKGILERAMTVVTERGEDYDHPAPNHERIAALWSVILERDVTPLEVVNCMIAVKLARLVKTPDHRDSLVDIAGYADCAGAILDARER